MASELSKRSSNALTIYTNNKQNTFAVFADSINCVQKSSANSDDVRYNREIFECSGTRAYC